jgi:hypothetical protein
MGCDVSYSTKHRPNVIPAIFKKTRREYRQTGVSPARSTAKKKKKRKKKTQTGHNSADNIQPALPPDKSHQLQNGMSEESFQAGQPKKTLEGCHVESSHTSQVLGGGGPRHVVVSKGQIKKLKKPSSWRPTTLPPRLGILYLAHCGIDRVCHPRPMKNSFRDRQPCPARGLKNYPEV